jgi:hypothetical protein
MTNISTTDFYVDSSTYENPSNFNIVLPHPINIKEESRAYITMKNFTMLNSIYNISDDLMNNTFAIRASRKSYLKVKSGTLIKMFDSSIFFQTTTGTHQHHPLAGIISHIDGEDLEILTTPTYTMYFRSTNITASNTNVSQNASIIRNIFDEDIINTTHYMRWFVDSYLIIKKNSPVTNGDFLGSILVERYYTKPGSGVAQPISLSERIRVYGSHDGINWVEATYGSGNIAITWTEGDLAQNHTTKQYAVVLDWLDDYIFYKINFETAQNPAVYYNNFETTKCYLEKYPTSSVVFQNDFFFQNNFTISDGSYSINTLMATINDFIISSGYNNVKVNYITYNNKLTITSTQGPYVYSALNKIDTQYNLEFIFSNKLKKMLGFVDNPTIMREQNITATNFINLLSFKKILITSNLKLTNKPITSLSIIDKSDGVGDVLIWIDRDVIPFEYINYINATDYKLQIDNKNIANINLKITNEFGQILNLPTCLLHFEISVIDNDVK